MQPYAKRTLDNPWKILIIDDDEEDFLIVKDMLSEAKGRKFEVQWAATYAEGQKNLANNVYDAVLVDYDLGLHSGIALIRAANEQGFSAPLILFTGRGGYEVDIEAMQAGATLYLTKNEVNPLLLERSIRYAIELKQRENALRKSEAELRQSAEKLERELTERRRAEEALRKSQAELSMQTRLIELSYEPIMIWDLAGGILSWNEGCEQLYGYSRAEALGQVTHTLLHTQHPIELETFIRQLQANRRWMGELRHLTKDGREIIVESRQELLEKDGRQLILETNHDITERKQAERELRESEAWFRTTLSSIGDAVITCNPQSEVTFLNPVAEKLTGWKQAEAIGQSLEKIFNIINEQTRCPAKNPVGKVLQTGMAIGLANHTALIARSGQEIPVEDSAAPIIDADGQITGIVLVFHDVTAQRKATGQLRYQADLLAQVQDAVIASNDQWAGTYWNKKAEEIFGWAREEVIGKPLPEILQSQFPGSSRDQARKELLKNGHWEGEVVYRRKDGSSFSAQVKTARLTGMQGELVGYVTAARDITELKLASEALQKSEEKFAKAFRSSPIALAISTVEDGRFIEINDSYGQLYGYSREEVIGHTSVELGIILPEDRKEIIERFRHGKGFRNIELRARAKSGEIRNVLFSTEPIEIDGKEHMLSVIMNNTERILVEAKLRESEARLNTIFENSPVAIGITRLKDQKIIQVNEAFLYLYGYTREEAVGRTTAELNIWEFPAERQRFIELLQTGQHIRNFESTARLKSGSTRHVMISGEKVEINGEHCLVAQIIDITERKKDQVLL